MKRFILLGFIVFTHIMVYGDVESQCKDLFKKSSKEKEVHNYAKALEYLIKAKTIAENNNSIKIQIAALNNMAVIYEALLDYKKVMECYLEAYQMIIEDTHKEYKEVEMCVLNNISYRYFDNKEYAKSKEYLQKAYEIAIQLQDSVRMGGCACNFALMANHAGELEEAEKYLQFATTVLKNQAENSRPLLYAKQTRIENLYLKKEYNKAERLTLEVLNQNFAASDIDIKVRCFLYLSRIYLQKKESQKAIKAAKEALNNYCSLPVTVEIYEQLSKIYLEMNDPYLAIQYLDSMAMLKDSIAKVTDMTNVITNQVKFDLMNSEKALAESKAKQKAEHILLGSILVFVTILAIIFIVLFRIQSIRNKQQKQITALELQQEKNQKLILEQQSKEKETLALLEQEKLNNEIEIKNQQLTAKILSQFSKNDFIEDTIEELSEILGHSDNPMLEAMIRKLKIQLTESSEWETFLTCFEQMNPALAKSLKDTYSNLTVNDIQLLACIYLNLDANKISNLLNISVSAYHKRKERLATKMEIKTMDMYNYLQELVSKR